MANTIKLKQGSGSDPSASDLALGEPAVRTDTGEIFLKKDDGSIAKVAGGIDDGDKGDITVSNSGATFTIDNDAVSFDKIANVPTSRLIGRVSSGTGSIETLTANDARTFLNVANGATNVTNTNQLTNGAGFITATLTNEQVQDIVGGMVSSNTETGITVTYQDGDGTLDFAVTSQTDENFTTTLKNKLDGIAASATNVTNNNQLTNGAGYITATLTNEQVQDIVGGMVTGNTESGITVTYQDGDGTLDFSVASQTDNNFTNADHSKLDGIEAGATADQSASEILTLLKTVDGSGSGLDADTLDGIGSGSFLRADAADTASGDITFSGGGGAVTVAADSDIRFTNSSSWTGDVTGKIQQLNNVLYISGGSSGILFRESGTNRWQIDGSGHFEPATDSTYDIGESSLRVRVGYFDELDSAEVRVNNGILEMKAAIATSHTLTADYNAIAVDPTINNGVTVTVPSGATWAIV